MWELWESGHYEASMHVVECFLLLWCMTVYLGAYLVVVVHYG